MNAKYKFTAPTVYAIAGVWATIFLFTIIQSMLNAPVAGVAPEAIRLTLAMTAPFTLGLTIVAVGTALAADLINNSVNRPRPPCPKQTH